MFDWLYAFKMCQLSTFSTNVQATAGTTALQKCCMCCTPRKQSCTVNLSNQQVGLHWISILSLENRDRHPSHERSCFSCLLFRVFFKKCSRQKQNQASEVVSRPAIFGSLQQNLVEVIQFMAHSHQLFPFPAWTTSCAASCNTPATPRCGSCGLFPAKGPHLGEWNDIFDSAYPRNII